MKDGFYCSLSYLLWPHEWIESDAKKNWGMRNKRKLSFGIRDEWDSAGVEGEKGANDKLQMTLAEEESILCVMYLL